MAETRLSRISKVHCPYCGLDMDAEIRLESTGGDVIKMVVELTCTTGHQIEGVISAFPTHAKEG